MGVVMAATPEPELVRRASVIEKARKQFDGKTFKLGRRDCARLASAVLSGMGHTVPKLPPYKTELGARRAIAALGAETLEGVLDGLALPRIPPAAALPGDLLYMPCEGTVGAIVIAVGNGAALGFHQDHVGLVAMRPTEVLAAWRV